METNIGSAILKMLGSLILILGLIFLLFGFLKRIKTGVYASGRSPMRLVNLLNLGPKKSVALVEIAERWFVLGVTADQITLIDKLDRPAEGAATEQVETGRFQDFLRKGLANLRSVRKKEPEHDPLEKQN